MLHVLSSLLIFGSTLATPSPDLFIRHEKRDLTSTQWVKRSAAPLDVRLPMRINLKHRNTHLGHDRLVEISDPLSKNYGKHWTAKEVEDFFAPHDDSFDAVLNWLSDSGLSSERVTIFRGRGLLKLDVSVDEAEALLKTQYHLYEHEDTGDFTITCDEYSLHHSVHDHIDFVTPTVNFPSSTTAKRSSHVKLAPEPAVAVALRTRDIPNSPVVSSDPRTACNSTGFGITPQCIKGK
jgi:tripeptidyl-peptidase I